MKAIWNGTILAESSDTLVVEGNHYFPADSLKREHFEQSDTPDKLPLEGHGELLPR